jgi:hypothetical protein
MLPPWNSLGPGVSHWSTAIDQQFAPPTAYLPSGIHRLRPVGQYDPSCGSGGTHHISHSSKSPGKHTLESVRCAQLVVDKASSGTPIREVDMDVCSISQVRGGVSTTHDSQ